MSTRDKFPLACAVWDHHICDSLLEESLHPDILIAWLDTDSRMVKMADERNVSL